MRRYRTLAAMTAGLTLLGSAAFADIVYNDIDNNVDTTLESIVMEVGDAPETVGLYIQVQNATTEGSGGENGCNLKGGRQLVLDIANSNTAAVTVTADSAFRFASNSSKVLLTGDCEQDVDGVSTPVLKATLSVAANSATPVGTPAVISFSKDLTNSTALGNWSLTQASFDVTVTEPDNGPTRDAPAIANEHLSGQDNDYTDACKEELGTNGKAGSRGHKSNWHGQLISNVAKHFEGETFTAAQESMVTDYVDDLCFPPTA